MESRRVIRVMVICGLVGSLVLLTGCFGKERVRYEDRVTQVPYLVFRTPPPAPEVDVRESYPTDEITEETSDKDVARAFVKTLEILRSEVKNLSNALLPYTEEALEDWTDEERQEAERQMREETQHDG